MADNQSISLLREIMETELGQSPCIGSDNPFEDLAGRIQQFLLSAPVVKAEVPDGSPQYKEHCMKRLCDRFLTWKLPASVSADLCATIPHYQNPRSGTNLLSADEARQMVEYVFADTFDAMRLMLRKSDTMIYPVSGKAPQPTQAVPEGWKLMPVEPTQAMIDAADRVAQLNNGWQFVSTHAIYRALISASPAPADQWRDIESAPRDGTADSLKEPKNGKQWRVEWWNESMRLMLPADKVLDSFQSYKNGTLQFTLKAAPSSEQREGE